MIALLVRMLAATVTPDPGGIKMSPRPDDKKAPTVAPRPRLGFHRRTGFAAAGAASKLRRRWEA
jgi:hypothetical protein